MKTSALLLAALSLLPLAGHAFAATKPASQQPNILYILADFIMRG